MQLEQDDCFPIRECLQIYIALSMGSARDFWGVSINEFMIIANQYSHDATSTISRSELMEMMQKFS